MKKILLKDILEFRSWQSKACSTIGECGQKALLEMEAPTEYPCVLCWSIAELMTFESHCFETVDKLQYQYIYLGNFPLKNVKRGTYVYQVFQTDGVCDV